MFGKALTYNEVQNILANNGYFLVRSSGGHDIYKDDLGFTIALPHKTKALSMKTVKREFKKHGIKERW